MHRSYRTLLVLAGLSLALAGGASRTFAEEKAGGRFRGSAIREQVTYLASDALRGRGSGEKGNELAAQYIARQFARAGLKPVGTDRQKDPAAPLNGSGYFQPFTFDAGRVVGKSNRLEVRFGGRRVSYRAGQEFEPSGVSGAGKADGELVFVGYGIRAPQANHDDYAGVDVKGKVALMLAGAPGSDPHGPLAEFDDIYKKAFAAREQGASAVLVVIPRSADTPRTGFDKASDASIPVLRVRYPIAEQWLAAGRVPLAEMQKKADAGEKVSAPTGVQVKLTADVEKITKITANVVGLLEGSDPALKNEVVVIGAHMDHLGMGGANSLDPSGKPAIHAGADDNASGTAGVMQLASYFGSGSESGGGNGARGVRSRPKRSLLFICFSGEELGLLGSAHYTRSPILPLDKTAAMLNMDMIGRLRDNTLIVSGTSTAKEWNALLDSANGTSDFKLARSDSGFGASDQQSFYLKEVPVLFFFTGTHEDYHRPSDTAEKINAEGEAKVLELVLTCAERIADNAERPTFQKMTAASDPGRMRGSRVVFGSMPDYAAQVEGVLLSGVREGTPAAKAGLKAGDIIVKFGDSHVKNVQDYSVALGNYKPGDVVVVVVQRGSETLTFKVTLAARKE